MTNYISTEHFTHWLKGQPRDIAYRFTDNDDCVIARYLMAHGLTNPRVSTSDGTVRVGGQRVRFHIPGPLRGESFILACTYGELLDALTE